MITVITIKANIVICPPQPRPFHAVSLEEINGGYFVTHFEWSLVFSKPFLSRATANVNELNESIKLLYLSSDICCMSFQNHDQCDHFNISVFCHILVVPFI